MIELRSRHGYITTVALAMLAAVLLFLASSSRATVLVPLTFDGLVSSAELVFTGTVTDSFTGTEGDLVYTTVRFEIDTVVIGEAQSNVLELRFLGGVDGEQQTEVSAQYIPAIGDRGLYFVDHTTRDLVNPLVGWSQGYFPLVDIDGTTWLDLKNHPDYGLLEPDADPLAGKMRSLNFTREQIAERFPERFRFPLADFVTAIADIRAAQEAE
jgi:hypothetical protein